MLVQSRALLFALFVGPSKKEHGIEREFDMRKVVFVLTGGRFGLRFRLGTLFAVFPFFISLLFLFLSGFFRRGNNLRVPSLKR